MTNFSIFAARKFVGVFCLSLSLCFLPLLSAQAQETSSCQRNSLGDVICPGDGGAYGATPLSGSSGSSVLGPGSPLVSGLQGDPSFINVLGDLQGLFDLLPGPLQNVFLLELMELMGSNPTETELLALVTQFTTMNDDLTGMADMECGSGTPVSQDFMTYSVNNMALGMSVGGTDYDAMSAAAAACDHQNNPAGGDAGGSWVGGDVEGAGGDRIASAAKARIGYSTAHVPGTNNGNLACAWSVSTILQDAGYGLAGGTTLGTAELRQWLIDDPCYAMVDTGDITAEDAMNLQPGDILVTPTNFDKSGASGTCRSSLSDRCNSGHTGIYIGDGQIVSNGGSGGDGSSASIKQNYTVESWRSGVSSRNTSESAVFRRTCE